MSKRVLATWIGHADLRALAQTLVAQERELLEADLPAGRADPNGPIKTLLELEFVELHVKKQFEDLWSYLNTTCRGDLEQIVPNGVLARVFVWEGDIVRGNSATDRPHDRFLLTDCAGVQVGWGFDARRDSRTTITLLDDETCREIENDLSLASSRFRKTCSNPIELIGKRAL